MNNFVFQEIGQIESCYPDKFGTPRQPGLTPSSMAKISFHKEWQPQNSLQGLQDYSHLWVVFVFHLNKNKSFHAKVHPPRLQGESMGVFATRSPHRANPIGLSLVKIEKIEDDAIYISGVDLVNGTPVIDIKPYLPQVESIPEAKSGWSGSAEIPNVKVQWTDEQIKLVQQWSLRIAQPSLQQLIEETLAQDPRPVVYRGYEGKESPYRDSHAVRIYDGDIHFKFLDDASVEITQILISN